MIVWIHMSKPKKDERSSSSSKSIQIPADILKDLLTPSEWRMLKNRFQIMNLLEGGLSIRKTAERLRVGTDTVVRVARMMEKGNLRKTLSNGPPRKIRTNTPWIFGKSE